MNRTEGFVFIFETHVLMTDHRISFIPLRALVLQTLSLASSEMHLTFFDSFVIPRAMEAILLSTAHSPENTSGALFSAAFSHCSYHQSPKLYMSCPGREAMEI